MSSTDPARDWPADDVNISYEGRTAVGAGHRVRMGFPGIAIRLRVNAAVVRARIDASSDDVFFNVSVDSKAPRRIRLHKGINDVELLRADLPGVHALELVRRTESWQGVCELLGFSVAEGAILAPAALPDRRMLFIGDSVTCGEGTEAADTPGVLGAERSNASASYGAELARRLLAQVHLVSYGGRGIIMDWQGIRDTNNAPVFYGLALPDDPNCPWDPRSYVPDVIGICLGTNDFSQGIPAEDEFVGGYVGFLERILGDAPSAAVILIDSPILEDGDAPKKSTCRSYIDKVVRIMNRPNVSRAWVKHCVGSPGDAHPVAAEHMQMADELEPAFRRAAGWPAN